MHPDSSSTEPPADPTVDPRTPWLRAWAFVPTLYFVQGLPYVIVNNVSVVVYKTLGVANSTIAFWTSWLSLVWAFKALWSPFVDGVSTKRRWTVAMQLAMVPVLVLVAFSLPLPWFLPASLALFFVLAFLSATHDIAADGLYMVGLDDAQQSAFVGVRSTAWRLAPLIGEPAMIFAAGWLAPSPDEGQAWAWGQVLIACTGVFAAGTLWHGFILPVSPEDRPQGALGEDAASGPLLSRLWATAEDPVRTFLAKPGIVTSILFILFFRFAENHMAKLLYPFLIDPLDKGGLGLTLEDAAIAKGTVGLSALTLGGILGGYYIFQDGLKRWLWPMAIAINVPNLVYVYLSFVKPQDFLLISASIGVESFGYGFGFTAYMMYLIKFAEGPYKTAHYAFATGLMAAAVSLSSFWSGFVQEWLGYDGFFVWVVVATVPGFVITGLVDVPPEFGKREEDEPPTYDLPLWLLVVGAAAWIVHALLGLSGTVGGLVLGGAYLFGSLGVIILLDTMWRHGLRFTLAVGMTAVGVLLAGVGALLGGTSGATGTLLDPMLAELGAVGAVGLGVCAIGLALVGVAALRREP